MTSPADPADLAKKHQEWLADAAKELKKLPQALQQQWWTQDLFNQWTPKFGPHYTEFDRPRQQQMVWRFTSKPVSESIEVKSSTSIKEIIEVVGRHSGGNDKENPNVKTSSFCRNIGAILGTAASSGGDKGVLNIIVQAAYLCGINIGTLADHGVSAHPALARAISAFETEYVLVPTPGNASLSLSALATVIYENPFKSLFGVSGKVKGYNITLPIKGHVDLFEKLLKEGPKPTEPIELKGKPDDLGTSWVKEILGRAVKYSIAATQQSFTVQDKEPTDLNYIENAMKIYLRSSI